MPAVLRFLLLALALLCAGAPAAQAAGQALVDAPPMPGAQVKDRVFDSPPRAVKATAAQAAPVVYRTASDGTPIQVYETDQYKANPTIAQSYVDFLGNLPHGTELAKLSVVIESPAEVQASCGGEQGILACYSGGSHIMILPGEQPSSASTAGITVSYIIAHEYGHHVASFRNNAPFPTLDYGPKYWASYEMVCTGVINGTLFPGVESGEQYHANPGENWAETYARLVYPEQAWTFSPLLEPDAGALEAARRDVLTPWAGDVTKAFKGTFKRGFSNKRDFKFTLHLDGDLDVRLKGTKNTDEDLVLSSLGKVRDRTKTRGSRDRLNYDRGACRERAAETVTITVLRRKGYGPFSVSVTYAG